MEGIREYIVARRDVALVGGSYGDEVTLRFGDESFSVAAGEDGATRMVVLANAYEATDPETGERALFLVKDLSPMAYDRVEVGKAYVPQGCGGGEERAATPAVESFPMALHPTDLLRSEIAQDMVSLGAYGRSPELRFALLVVALGQGDLPDAEWGEAPCERMLADMRSGNLLSATLNMDGRMSVEIVGRVNDFAAAANEAVISIYLHACRMRMLHGSGWEGALGYEGLSRGLAGNILYSLPPFMMRECEGDPHDVARALLVPMRLRGALNAEIGRDSSWNVADMPCFGMGTAKTLVALAALALSDPSDPLRVRLPPSPDLGRGGLGRDEFAEEVGSVIQGIDEARRVVSTMWDGGLDVHGSRYAMLLVEALLGSPYGQMALSERRRPADGRRSSSGVALALLIAILATEGDSTEWAEWVASRLSEVAGTIAYADALIEAVHDATILLHLHDVTNALQARDESVAIPDWEAIAERARAIEERHRQEQGAQRGRRQAEPDGVHDDWHDEEDRWYDDDWYDEEDYWHESELCLYSLALDELASEEGDEARMAGKVNRFVDLCVLSHACRMAFRHLGRAGWVMLLDRYPLLSLLFSEEGKPRPFHNDMVACAYEAFKAMAVEDGFFDATPTGLSLPGIVMDDGSVMGCHIEPGFSGGYVAHITCDGEMGCMMLPASMEGFGTTDDIMDALFEICVATGEADGEGDARLAGQGSRE